MRRVDLTAVEQMHVDGASAYFTTVCETCGYQWPCTTSRLAEALRIAREALVAITGIPPTDDTANAALNRIDALVDFGDDQ